MVCGSPAARAAHTSYTPPQMVGISKSTRNDIFTSNYVMMLAVDRVIVASIERPASLTTNLI